MEYLRFSNLSFARVEYIKEHIELFEQLFKIDDVAKYFILSPEYNNRIKDFVQYLAICNQKNVSLDFVIYSNSETPIGILTAEAKKDGMDKTYWNIAYALLKEYRHYGYASCALKYFGQFVTRFPIDTMALDISIDNDPSIAVAKRCGFEQLRDNNGVIVSFFDWKRPNLEMRHLWIKKVHCNGKREDLCEQALYAYNIAKDYPTTINLFLTALQLKPMDGSTWTDAQIYSNLGIAHSANHQYAKAFEYLTKAWDMGIKNPSVIRELKWLQEHKNLW